MSAKTQKVSNIHVVKGVKMECISCHNTRWCHPRLEMCGTCTFGEAGAQDEFEGSWEEGDIND